MYRLVTTSLADDDLDEIVGYIRNELKNEKAATDFVEEVLKCYENLEQNPKMYAVCTEANLFNKGYRKAKIKNYLLVFKIDESTKTVYIMRFFYGARNYFDLL